MNTEVSLKCWFIYENHTSFIFEVNISMNINVPRIIYLTLESKKKKRSHNKFIIITSYQIKILLIKVKSIKQFRQSCVRYKIKACTHNWSRTNFHWYSWWEKSTKWLSMRCVRGRYSPRRTIRQNYRWLTNNFITRCESLFCDGPNAKILL